MKKAIFGLVGIVSLSSCLKPLDERAIDIVVERCNNMSQNSAFITNLDLPVDNEYLTPSQIARVDYVLQEKTNCYLSVYLDKESGWRCYLVQKENSAFTVTSFKHPQYEKVYPTHQ